MTASGAVPAGAGDFSAGAGALSAGAVARRLGVAVTTLRTWHQRYGLGPSLHEPGQHRRYTEEDIKRLEEMQRLIVEGIAPGEAARWVSSQPLPHYFRRPSPLVPHRDGGGLALGDAGPAARGLSRAALRLDGASIRDRIARAIRDLGVVGAWDTVLRPVLFALGERHATTGAFVEVEHLLSQNISAVLGAIPRPRPGLPVRIMLACADEEQHSLPLEALAGALAAEGVPTRMLGARVPRTALTAAVRRTGPSALVLWSHTHFTADPGQLLAVLEEKARPLMVVAAGPGWPDALVPPGVGRPLSLAECLSTLTSPRFVP